MKYVVTNSVITAAGRELDRAVIAVDDRGKIVEILNAVPDEGQTVDWSSYVVIPGMIDAHDHLSIDLGDEEAQSKESTTTHVLRSVRNAKRILHAGITTLRDVGARGYIDVDLRDAIARGELDGPRLVVSGQFITRTGGHAWYFGDEVDGPDEVRKAVRKQAKHRVDLIKMMVTGGMGTPNSDPTSPGFSRDEIAAGIDEAHALGYKVAAHIHGGPAARWAVESGLDTLEHGIYCTEDDLRAMADHGTYLIVTYGLIDEALRAPHVPVFFKEKARTAQASYDRVLRSAVELGVKIAVGGDTYHADMPDELRALVKAGMSPLEAITAATRNGAEACGILTQTGTIETGKDADLVALGSDPRRDIGAVGDVRGVMKRGAVVR